MIGDDKLSTKLQPVLDEYERTVRKLIEEARLDGFEQGLAQTVKAPSAAQFSRDHKEPVTYGEDFAYVVASRSRRTAARLLETDEDCIEEVEIGWRPYEVDGEMTVGYHLSRSRPGLWTAWGVYL